MERIVHAFGLGAIDRDLAVQRTRREGFRYVLDAFHTLPGDTLRIQFYRVENDWLLVTDDAMRLLAGDESDDLAAETDARWGLLESAFAMNRALGRLRMVCDERAIYLAGEPDRAAPRPIVSATSALHGYQDGRCLHCGEPVHIDEGTSRTLTPAGAGSVWGLVLTHDACAAAATTTTPTAETLGRLARRNERLVASSHPLGDLVRRDLGGTPGARARSLRERMALPPPPRPGRGSASGWA